MEQSATSLTETAAALAAKAAAASSGRAAQTVYGGHEHRLRQTLIALRGGFALGEHEAPPEATLHVLSGRVVLDAGERSWPLTGGDLLPIPQERHDLRAESDAVVMLTVFADG